MRMFLECAKANAGRHSNGWRYNSVLSEFGTMMFALSGPRAYEIFNKNLPVPSTSMARHNLRRQDLLTEGVFRFSNLKKHCEIKRTKKVYVKEDGTRVTGGIQYCALSNQVVGFKPPFVNGVPVANSFPATSASKIASYFENGVVSNNAYVIMARPIAKDSKPYVVTLFGSDNKFSALDVHHRWQWMTSEAHKNDIEILGFSSDGDPRLLRVMFARVFTQPDNHWPWFSADRSSEQIFTQDTVHLVAKLRCKLSRASDVMPMGRGHLASRTHIISLVQTVSKDQHELTMSCVDIKDKMNYRTAQKLCQEKVSDLLRQHVPESEATAVFLDMMREFSSSFLDRQMEPLLRVTLSWKWIFFSRLWRLWIQGTPGYSLAHNFITSNAYTSMELNGHALIQMLRRARDLEEPDLFQPWHCDSQDCEEFFRESRSLTTCESTVTNYSILEFTHRIRKIDYLRDSYHKLDGIVNFPARQKTFRVSGAVPVFHPVLPEDYEIKVAVEDAFKIALAIAVKLGMAKPSAKIPQCPLKPNAFETCDISETEEDEDVDTLLLVLDDEEGEGDISSEEDDALADNEEEALMLSTGSLGTKSFPDVTVTPTCPYVKVLDGQGEEVVVRKTFLLYMLCNGSLKMSSDRLLRVQTNAVHHSLNSLVTARSPKVTQPQVREEVELGDWCAFTSEDGSVAIGKILAFSYMAGRTWRQQEYKALTAPVRPPPETTPRELGCLCNWFSVGKNRKLVPTMMDLHGYYKVDNYICNIPRPKVEGKSFFLTCSMRAITQLKN